MSALDARYADEAFDKLYAMQQRAGKAGEVRPDLVPFLRLPPPERPAVTRARMAQLIQDRFSAEGRVTVDDLEAAGFTKEEIVAHFHGARRIAKVERMVA